MKALVIYFSRTGNTKIAAEAIAKELSCDVEELVDTTNWSGPLGWINAGRQASSKALTKLEPLTKDPSQYDIVVVGTPVWAGTMATPVRTFLAENKDKLKSVAFFVTMSSRGDEPSFHGMEEVTGKKPAATLALRTADVKSGACAGAIKKFADGLRA